MAIKKMSKEISEKTLQDMCNDKFKLDFSNLLRSRYPLFFLTTNEEKRLISFLDHFSIAKGYDCYLWDSYNGLVNLSDGEASGGVTEDLKNNPIAILDYIIGQAKIYEKKKTAVIEKQSKGVSGIVYVLLDYFRFVTENPDVERRLKTIASLNSIVSTIITGPSYRSTEVLENLVPVLDFPYANKKEIRHALYEVAKGAEPKIPEIIAKTKEKEEELIDAVSGLTLMEAQTAFSKSLVSHYDWHIPTILEEKKQIISKNGLLEYYDQPVSLTDVGGLKRLVTWVKDRRKSFSQEAEQYGLKKPRGLLTIGMPGCVLSDTKIRIKKISEKGKHRIY